MSAPRKFDEETRARAVRRYQDRLREPELGASLQFPDRSDRRPERQPPAADVVLAVDVHAD